MSVGEFQKVVTYIREAQEVALFVTMADSRWFAAFGVSPLFFVMLPFIGILLTIQALINTYHLVKADNKNINLWFGFIASVVCAVLASISLYGAAISAIWGVSFAAGPWFFFSSLMVAAVHQATMLGLNIYRAYESLPGSAQRMHYIQAAINNLFLLSVLAAAVTAVIFVMLIPGVAPVAGIASAITASVLTLIDMGWRMGPHNWKLLIKDFFHLGKPKSGLNEIKLQNPGFQPNVEKNQEQNPNYHRLFTCFDYSAEVRRMDTHEAQVYLQGVIRRKIESYGTDVNLHTKKTTDKLAVLEILAKALSGEQIFKSKLLSDYPLAFQSVLVEKGDVEQIFDAVCVFQKKSSDKIINLTVGV